MRSKILMTIFTTGCLSAYGEQAGKQASVETKNRTMEVKMKIEIWSDIMCPFCYIGKRNLEKALYRFPNKEQVEIEWKSFQLDPTIPEVPEHQDDMYMFVADRKGLSYEQSQKMHLDLIQYAKSAGLEYNLDKALVTNSLKSHQLLQFAKTKGLGEEAEEILFCAYFTQGKNLSEVGTLIELGKEIGLTEIEVHQALTHPLYVQKVENDTKEAQTLGARGVPFFVIDRKYAIAGAQQASEFLKALEKAFAEWQKDHPVTLKMQEGKLCELNGDCT